MEKDMEKLKTCRRILISSIYVEAIGVLLQIIEYGFVWFVFAELAFTIFCDVVFYITLKKNEAKLYNKMAQQKARNAETIQQAYRCPTCNNTVFYDTATCQNCGTAFEWSSSMLSDKT